MRRILFGVCVAGLVMGAVRTKDALAQAESRAALRADLAYAREAGLNALNAYWRRGEFVQNPDPKGGRGHSLLDAQHRPCPLAYMVIQSGNRPIIEDLARANNGVKVADVRKGPLVQWILRSGLTREECILIQQPGGPGRETEEPVRERDLTNLASTLKSIEEELRANTERSLDRAMMRLTRS